MRPAGLKAFEARTEARTAVYSYEQRHQARLTGEEEARFRANKAAWTWFEAQPPSYRDRRRLLDQYRQASGDPGAPAGSADRGVGHGSPAEAADPAGQEPGWLQVALTPTPVQRCLACHDSDPKPDASPRSARDVARHAPNRHEDPQSSRFAADSWHLVHHEAGRASLKGRPASCYPRPRRRAAKAWLAIGPR